MKKSLGAKVVKKMKKTSKLIFSKQLAKLFNPLNIVFSLIFIIFETLSFMTPSIMPLIFIAFTFSNLVFITIYTKPLRKFKKELKRGELLLQLAFIVSGLIIIIGILLAVFYSDSRYYLNNPDTKQFNYLMCTLASLLFLFHISVEQSLFITLRERGKSFPRFLGVVLIGLLILLGLTVILTEGFTVGYLPLKYFVYTGYILLTLCPRYTMLKFLFSEKKRLILTND